MSASAITPYPVPCAQQCRHTVGHPATSMHRYSSAVAPGSPGPVTAEPSLTGQSSHDQPQTRTYFPDRERVERLMLAGARHRRKEEGDGRGSGLSSQRDPGERLGGAGRGDVLFPVLADHEPPGAELAGELGRAVAGY